MTSCTATDASRYTCCSMGLARYFEMYLLQPGVILRGVIHRSQPMDSSSIGVPASPGAQ